MITVQAVLADRTYDSDAILAWVTAQGAVPVIPPHPVRSDPRPTDWHLYKERARIECLFGKPKHFRRFDKLARRYLAAACILLR
jgi:transposase